MDKAYDYIILGAGVAGLSLAKKLAKKSRVLLIEEEKLGGTSLRMGAVPVKKLLDSFKQGQDPEKVRQELRNTWKVELDQLDQIISQKLEDENIDLLVGQPRLLGANRLELGASTYSARQIIIATGTRPGSRGGITIDEGQLISHRRLVEEPIFNQDIVVYGASVEGIEIANLLLLLGNRVWIVEAQDQILPGKDRDLIQPIEDELIRLGATIKTSTSLSSTRLEGDRLVSLLSSGEEIKSQLAISTLFRQANLPLGLENTQVKLENGFIKVDQNFRSQDPAIYAIGDINGLHGMAHVALDQARILAGHLEDGSQESFDYSQVPGAYFTRPEYVGLGPGEIDLAGQAYKLGRAQLKNNFRGWAKSYRSGFVKVILDPSNRLRAIHMVGDNVAESLGFLGYFIGRPAEEILKILIVHPSLGESIKEAIENALEGEVYEASTH